MLHMVCGGSFLYDSLPEKVDMFVDSADVATERDAELFTLEANNVETDYEPG